SRLEGLMEEGFVRIQSDDKILRLDEEVPSDLNAGRKIWVLVDRVEVGKTSSERLNDSIETAFRRGAGRLSLLGEGEDSLFDQRLICPHCEILYPEPDPSLL